MIDIDNVLMWLSAYIATGATIYYLLNLDYVMTWKDLLYYIFVWPIFLIRIFFK